MPITATVTPGAVVQAEDKLTVSLLNQLANPTVDIAGSLGNLTLQNGSVNNEKIADEAQINLNKLEYTTAGKIAIGNQSGAPAWASLGGDASMSYDAAESDSARLSIGNAKISTAMLQDSSVSTDKIADDSVTASKLGADSVGTSEIQSNAVGTAEIQDNAVQGSKVADGVITAAKFASGALAGSPRAPRKVLLTSSGGWTVPSGVTEVYVEMVGAGSGPGSNNRGGGGGAYVATHLDVTPGGTITFTIGSGGGSTHQPGGASSFTHGGTTYTAGGGTWAHGHNAYATGGIASGGEINADGYGAGTSAGNGAGFPSMGPFPPLSYGTGQRNSWTNANGAWLGSSSFNNHARGGAVLITY